MAGSSYTRQSTFGDGDVITAALFNNEFNQVLNAFSYSATGTTGHQHDGGAGEGGNIEIIGDGDFLNKILVDGTNNRWGFYVQVGSGTVEQIRIQDGAIVPVTDNDIDLGTSSLQFKNAFINGTLEADAITIAGITLSETIADTVGAMVTSNAETGITVTYEDSDNTLDFAIGTLNQSTTGNAATATALATARTIGGTSFDGTANIAVALSATATALATARTIHGVSFDGTANIDLAEVIADTVGAMFTSNTETGITVTYQDADNTIDLVVSGSADTTGNAATATALETARTIGGVSFDGTANISLAGVNSAGNQNTSGNAATATALATARTIGGTSFDGTANIAVALAAEATSVTAVANNSANETVYVTFVDGVSGTQGIETDAGLTYNPSTGLLGFVGVAGTGAVKVPAGSTAQRPTAAAGQLRYNSTTGKFEGYTDSWGDIGGGEATFTLNTMTGDGSDTTLTMSVTPASENSIQVYFDGVYQHKDTFSFSGTTLTFSTAPASGVKVEVMVISTVLASSTPGDGTVTLAKMAQNSIDSPQYVDGSIDLAHMSVNSVDSDQYVDGSIDTAHIADDAVTSAKLAHSLDIVTDLSVGGASNGVEISNGAIALKNSGTQSKIDFYCETSNAHYTRIQAAPHSSYSGNIVLTLPASDGDAGQFLQSNGSGVMSWAAAGGLYNDWLIKTAAYTMLSGDQIIVNKTSALTMTLPASPSVGDVVIVKATGGGTVTIGRNSQKINSVAADGTLNNGNSTQLVYVDSTIGWLQL
jgi:hypothetical protein